MTLGDTEHTDGKMVMAQPDIQVKREFRHFSERSIHLSTCIYSISVDFTWFAVGASFVAFCLVPILDDRGHVSSLA